MVGQVIAFGLTTFRLNGNYMWSRRPALVLALLIALVMTLTSCAGVSRPSPPTSAEATPAQLSHSGTPPTPPMGTSYGFTLSLSMDQNSTDNLDGFKQDIDGLVKHGQKWVRVGIASWTVAGIWDGNDQLTWNEENLKIYDQAISYARQQGLLVYLVTADGQNSGQSKDVYRKNMEEYWSVLAKRYASNATVWQLYNEVDAAHFSKQGALKGLSPDYLSELESMLAIGRKAIKSASPSTLVTTNASGWPVSDSMQQRWTQFFDAIAPTLDVIAVDVYPADSTEAVESLTARIKAMQKRYKKPVIVAEVGLQTCESEGCWTEADQGTYVSAAIKSLTAAKPMAIFAYEWRDTSGSVGGKDTFGIMTADRSPKSGFAELLKTMGDDS